MHLALDTESTPEIKSIESWQPTEAAPRSIQSLRWPVRKIVDTQGSLAARISF
jgi:hypothetical protein